ncbi:glycine cleavage system aminomethyltransferase GcvT [Immundisolibacter sp.]|uniref:glycine cleavage system aminomethyltransferase GcvT n=1 Tax=Immundisolibacter sp. TaxID=1934948 RepID=UPI0026187B1C|nr:glycine cleavage system aminomethyltransferase GcvT [Immundisolibacter sp.]MDD3651112.1 glycine cleavage system aminomethyltransferase GcvT [Immundisolibacter sp.]
MPDQALLETPLHALHLAAGARMAPFAGYDMPLHYGSQLDEHHAVRAAAGVFDVSHMAQADVTGPQAQAYLRHVLAGDVARLADGQALYACLLNERGGIIDDLLAYRLAADRYRLVLNAARRQADLDWLRAQLAGFEVALRPREDLAMLAVQGPKARALADACLPPALRGAAAGLERFTAAGDGDWLVARTGYTGEDGYEIMLPAAKAVALWQALLRAGVRPAGLGARDTLRLEAGLSLYGHEMDETVTPLECGLAWTVHFDPARPFIGRAALEAQRAAGVRRQRVGVVLACRGVLRDGAPVLQHGREVGVLTSGGFGPTVGRGIGLARVEVGVQGACTIRIRDRELPACVVNPPFVREGVLRVELPPLAER